MVQHERLLRGEAVTDLAGIRSSRYTPRRVFPEPFAPIITVEWPVSIARGSATPPGFGMLISNLLIGSPKKLRPFGLALYRGGWASASRARTTLGERGCSKGFRQRHQCRARARTHAAPSACGNPLGDLGPRKRPPCARDEGRVGARSAISVGDAGVALFFERWRRDPPRARRPRARLPRVERDVCHPPSGWDRASSSHEGPSWRRG
jgi:hypothetical protein